MVPCGYSLGYIIGELRESSMLRLTWEPIRKSPHPDEVHGAGSVSGSRWLLVLAAAFALLASPLAAQGPPGALARVMGKDVTVENGPGSASAAGLPGFWVANGSTITVNSGQARLSLVDGGDVYICGPAKMTYLESNGAITLALSFGKVHATIPSSLPFKIFTPLVIGTPIAIGDGDRDFTVGLDTTDNMCIRTEQGAARLEEQFTGQQMIVPLGGEFFITANSLNPVPGEAGSCDCDAAMVALAARAPDENFTGLAHPADSTPPLSAPPADRQPPAAANTAVVAANAPNAADTAAVPPPNAMAAVTPTPGTTPNSRSYPPSPGAPDGTSSSAATSPAVNAPRPYRTAPDATITPTSASTVNPPANPPANGGHPAVEFSVPASASESHPIAQPKKADSTTKAEDAPTWKVMMPPLTFSSESPQPAPDPDPRSILLIRESHVEPEWLFTGHVEGGAPTNGTPSPNANPGAANGKSPAQAPAAGSTGKKPGTKRHGFWSRMKGLFVGEPSKEPNP
jgi:hypothetical protein